MAEARLLIVIALLATASRATAQEAELPLETWRSLRLREQTLRNPETSEQAAVVVGETRYHGRIDSAGLRLTMLLRAELGTTQGYKTVPIIGSDVIVLSARSGTTQVPLVIDGEYWTWVTQTHGTAELTVELVVPATGPRGSTEYRFGVVESPLTELTCAFADRDLSPRVEGAVSNIVRQNASGGELTAIVGPVTSIHVVGFRELAEAPRSAAKLYADTQTLVSLADDVIELFSVVSLTILYAPQKRFRIVLPSGYELASADGQGAFQYTVEQIGDERVLTGETSYGIRQSYEISLRLRRPLVIQDTLVPLAIPRVLDVERDSGFVAIEVPGKIAITAIAQDVGARVTPIDVRELPSTLVSSSVTPIVRAFQYNDARAKATMGIARYPTKTLETGSVDTLRATSLLTRDGRSLTELDVSMRNAVQQYLTMELAETAAVRSAFVEGEPVKPSRDAAGRLLLPLVRSRQSGDGLTPIRVQLVYEERASPLSLFGTQRSTLPALTVPIASLEWTVQIPTDIVTGKLYGAVEPQVFASNAAWQPTTTERREEEDDYETNVDGRQQLHMNSMNGPAGLAGSAVQAQSPPVIASDRDSGGMAVRVQVPHSGRTLSYTRYWASANEPVWLAFHYVGRTFLRTIDAILVVALLAAIVAFVVRARAIRQRLVAWSRASSTNRWQATKTVVRERLSSFADGFRKRREQSVFWALVVASAQVAWMSALIVTAVLLTVAFVVAAAKLAWLIGHPLLDGY